MEWNRNNVKYLKGSNHPKSKPKLYYAYYPVSRSVWKRTCMIQGWDCNDFGEVYSDKKYRSTKLYYHPLKELYERRCKYENNTSNNGQKR